MAKGNEVPDGKGGMIFVSRQELRDRLSAITRNWGLSAQELELTRKVALSIVLNPNSTIRDKNTANRILAAFNKQSMDSIKSLIAAEMNNYFPPVVTEVGANGEIIHREAIEAQSTGLIEGGGSTSTMGTVEDLRVKLGRCKSIDDVRVLKGVWFDSFFDPKPSEMASVNNGDILVYARGTPHYEFRRRELQLSMVEFGKEAFPIFQGVPYVHGKHAELLASYLQAFIAKKVRNLLVNIPPSHSKSSWLNVIAPAFCWTTNPGARFAHYTYNDTLGKRDSQWCRDLVQSGWYQHYFPEVTVRFGQNKIDNWGLDQGGSRVTAQPGAGMSTGGHPDYIMVDDPCSREMAESATEREKLEGWLFETMPSRGIARDAGMAVSMQAFHPDDISQAIKAKHKALLAEFGESPWHHVNLPGYYDPDLAMVDTGYGGDWRTEKGQLLWPELMNHERMEKLTRDIGAHAVEAQIQQNPKRRDGALFKVSLILDITPENPLPRPEDFDAVVRAWDRAATAEEDNPDACYTAGVLIGRVGWRKFYILDVFRKQIGWEEVEATIEFYVKLDEEKYGYDKLKTYFEREGGGSGKQVAEIMERRLKGHRVYGVGTRSRSKLARADGITTAISRREVSIVRAPWYSVFMEELSAFGRAVDQLDKDQVDALALAYNEMVNPSAGNNDISTPKYEKDREGPPAIPAQDMCKNPNCRRPAFLGHGNYCCKCCETAHKTNEAEYKHDPECNGRFSDWFARTKQGRA